MQQKASARQLVIDNSRTEKNSQEVEFSEKELEQIQSLVPQINIRDSGLVLQYGSAVQNRIAKYADKLLKQMKQQQKDETDVFIVAVNQLLHDFSLDDIDLNTRIPWKLRKAMTTLLARYSTVEMNLTRMQDKLEEQQLILMQDMDVIRHMRSECKAYLKEISMYICAGQKALAHYKDEAYAVEGTDIVSTESYNRLLYAIDAFESKLYQLSLSKNVAMQMVIQLEMLIHTDTVILEKIQSIIVHTIPLWKNQVSTTLGIANATEALKTQNSLEKLASEVIKKNAKNLQKLSTELKQETNHSITTLELDLANAMTDIRLLKSKLQDQQDTTELAFKQLSDSR